MVQALSIVTLSTERHMATGMLDSCQVAIQKGIDGLLAQLPKIRIPLPDEITFVS